MGPKKAATAAAEAIASPPKASENEVPEETNSDVAEKSGKVARPRKVSPHPTTMEMVKEALKELDSRKGVSAQAVRGFIKEKYPTVDVTRLKGMVRKALLKGIESGALVRPANATTTTGAQGRFRLAVRKTKEAKPAKKAKEAKENVNPNVGKAKKPKTKETGAEKAKPAKKAKATTEEGKPKKAKDDATASKVAPAKKPKTKRAGGDEEAEPKTQKRTKKTKDGSEVGDTQKASTKKGRKKEAQKDGESGNEGAAAAAPKKGGKKTEDGGKKASQKEAGGGEQGGAAAAPKASGRKGKKAAES